MARARKEPTYPVSLRVPVSVYDRMCREAQQSSRSLSDHLRARVLHLYTKVDTPARKP